MNIWTPNNEIRIELINNIEAFEFNTNYFTGIKVNNLVTFYTNEHGHRIIVIHSYEDNNIHRAKEFLISYFIETEQIIFSILSCDLLDPVIKEFAKQNDCELHYMINITV